MTRRRSDDVTLIDAGATQGAFERLRAGVIAALGQDPGRVLVDLSGVDPIDGAMLALLVRLHQGLGPASRIAVTVPPDAAIHLAEWRVDSLWPITPDRETAMRALGQ